jgi:site-specific DNA recombinase
VSGGLIDRPGMQAMLAYLNAYKDGNIVVIIDDISRFARDVVAHWELRSALEQAGGVLESPSIVFGKDSDARLRENMLASVAQHQREKNAEQTRHRMRARAMNGYWPFNAPIGFKFEQTRGRGKVLVHDEPKASVIKEAFEGYASGRFETPSEIMRFFEAHHDYPKDKNGKVNLARIMEMLERPIYAGFINHPRWNVEMLEGIISAKTWHKAQERKNGRSNAAHNIKAPARPDTNADFPLRGFVTCSECDVPLTAAWSKGRSKYYGYYFCQNKPCSISRKNIKKAEIEGDFETLLRQLRPKQTLFKTAYNMLKDLWEDRSALANASTKSLNADLKKLDQKSDRIFERLLEANNPTLINKYEGELRRIDEMKAVLTSKSGDFGTPLANFEDTYRTALEFLANPWKLWASEQLSDKRILLRLAFSGRISYHRENGYRTADLSLPFKVLTCKYECKNRMVPKKGFEPSLPYENYDLNVARLPIPPLGRTCLCDCHVIQNFPPWRKLNYLFFRRIVAGLAVASLNYNE